MPRAKVAISLDESTLERLDKLVERAVFSNRSQAIQEGCGRKARPYGQEPLGEGMHET